MRIEGWLAAGALSLIAVPALAQSIQLKPAVRLEVQGDDNVFRSSGGVVPREADLLTTVGAGGKLTLSESLQSLELRGEVAHTDYLRLDELDYDQYQVGAQLKLALASLLQLRVDASRERRQENFAFRDDTENGLITVDKGTAELRLRVTPSWTGIALGERYQTRTSREQSRDADLTEDSMELGTEYRLTGYSSFGLAWRQSEGDYPNRVVVAGDGREKTYDQQNLIVRAGYRPSGLSDLTAQLAYTQRTHEDPAVRDFRGITGRAGYTRTFSGISRLQAEIYRDLFYVEDINANYVENLGLKGLYEYRWSAKLSLIGSTELFRSSYQGSPSQNAQGTPRSDVVFGLSLGADYRPFYRFSLRPELRHEQRGSNTANGGYHFTTAGVDLVYEYGLANTR